MNKSLRIFAFHVNEDGVADGNVCGIGNGEASLEVEIVSTSTCKLIFECQGSLGVWRPFIGAKMTSELDLVTEATDTEPFYQFDLTGIEKVRMRLSENAGITTVVGRIVG